MRKENLKITRKAGHKKEVLKDDESQESLCTDPMKMSFAP